MRKIMIEDQEWRWSVKNNKLGVYNPETKEYAQRSVKVEDIGCGETISEAITPKKVREFILSINELEELKI
jgi:hypothetical protein